MLSTTVHERGRVLTIKRLILPLTFCLLAESAFAAKSDGRPLLLVSVYPVAAMAQEIAGDAFEVKPALPYGRSEHDYEASAKDVRTLRGADLLLIVDQTTDGWMGRATGNKVPVFEILPHVDRAIYGDTIGVAALGSVAAKSMGELPDPHFWLDPIRMGKAALAVANRLAEMTKIDEPTRKAVIARAKVFSARMTGLNAAIIEGAKSWRVAHVILAHGSLGYYSRLTGLKIIGILEPVPHVEPTPRHLGALIQLAKANKPCVVLAEEQIDDAVARALAREAGVPVTRINPMGYPEGTAVASLGAYDRYLVRFTKEVANGISKATILK